MTLNPLGLKLALLIKVIGSFGAMLGLLLVTPFAERKRMASSNAQTAQKHSRAAFTG